MKLLLTPLEGSLAFSERSLEVDPRSGCLTVSRASAQLKAATNNAVFDCKVNNNNQYVRIERIKHDRLKYLFTYYILFKTIAQRRTKKIIMYLVSNVITQ